MSDTVQRVQARARELAGSGKFAGWRALDSSCSSSLGSLKPMDGSIAHPPKKNLKACAKRREHGDKSNP
jgi:hypothetical protein